MGQIIGRSVTCIPFLPRVSEHYCDNEARCELGDGRCASAVYCGPLNALYSLLRLNDQRTFSVH